MKLQTQIPLEKRSRDLVDYTSNILLLGSCFVENIGEKFEYFKLKNLRNPFGILFHPRAIETLIVNAIHQKKYSEADIFFHNERWHSYDAHSMLSNSSKDDLLQHLNHGIKTINQQLHDSTHIIMTLGTAWVFNHYKSNLPVANCHKVPQKEFVKQLLSIDEITDSLKIIISHIRRVNPNVNFIFTVSPVRHIKDGFIENTWSKAHLIAGIHTVLSDTSQTNCSYFPSYEIMMDELRDYRFYADDMLHPNKIAVDYIWENFQMVWMGDETLKTMEEVENIQRGIQHRPFNPNSEAHQTFLQQLDKKIENLQTKFSHISFLK